MIQMRTILQVADNSGARKISCILPIGGSTGRYARLGDVITANVKESAPEAPEGWVMVVKPGRILYEMEGVPETEAREALRLAAHKLSITTRFVTRAEGA